MIPTSSTPTLSHAEIFWPNHLPSLRGLYIQTLGYYVPYQRRSYFLVSVSNLLHFHFPKCPFNSIHHHRNLTKFHFISGQPQYAPMEKPNWELEQSWPFPFYIIFQDSLKSRGNFLLPILLYQVMTITPPTKIILHLLVQAIPQWVKNQIPPQISHCSSHQG